MQLLSLTSVAVAVLGELAASAQPPKADLPAEKVRTIPLESCYATFGGNGCKYITDGGDKLYAFDMAQLFGKLMTGASNVAMVRGNDIAGGVKATRWAFTGGAQIDSPVGPDPSVDEKSMPLWMVAYLGAHSSSPPQWRLHSVEGKGHTVRVTYSKLKGLPGTADVRHYLLWIPMGHSQSGTYSLELFDKDRNEVTLSRRVLVAKSPSQSRD